MLLCCRCTTSRMRCQNTCGRWRFTKSCIPKSTRVRARAAPVLNRAPPNLLLHEPHHEPVLAADPCRDNTTGLAHEMHLHTGMSGHPVSTSVCCGS